MFRRHSLQLAAGAATVVAALALASGVAVGQAAVEPPAPQLAGLFRSELSLGGYTATFAWGAALDAQARAAAPSPSPSGGRVARLNTNTSLSIGDVAVGKRDPAGTQYDLWLDAPASGPWQLQIADVPQDGAPPSIVGRLALSGVRGVASPAGATDSGTTAAPGVVIALVPQADSSARLLVRRGDREAEAVVAFTDPPRTRRTGESTPPNTTVNRAHDEDTSALSRARMLAQRNETAFMLPGGERFSVSFQRTFQKGDRAAAGRPRGLPVDGPDFERLASARDGSIVLLTQAAVPRLAIDRPLRFGSTVVPTGNLVPGFPGSYGIWLKRAGTGWRLVFNHEPDAWGSQHDPKFDAAEIPLTHAEGPASSRSFAVGLASTAADRGRLLIVWGPHEWTADFTIAE